MIIMSSCRFAYCWQLLAFIIHYMVSALWSWCLLMDLSWLLFSFFLFYFVALNFFFFAFFFLISFILFHFGKFSITFPSFFHFFLFLYHLFYMATIKEELTLCFLSGHNSVFRTIKFARFPISMIRRIH